MKAIAKILFLSCFSIVMGAFSLQAQAPQGSLDEETLKKANDPMAHTKSFNVHDYIISSVYGVPDAGANQLLFRYAQPVGKLLLRGTLPVLTSSAPNVGPENGFGDFNLFAIYAMEFGGNKLGIGPLVTAPSGTHGFSSDKWQAGVAAMAFFAKNHNFQAGTLVQWQASFAGKDEAKDISSLTTQLFGMWQLGGGTYLRSTGIWSFDLKGGDYNIPLGLGIGKVVKVEGVVFNIFVEPQFSVLAKGIGQSKFQTFVGFNTQF